MAGSKFPHLKWTHKGTFEPKFGGNRQTPDEVKAAENDRGGHSSKLKTQLGELRDSDREIRETRAAEGLPEIAGKGFLLRVPEDADIDDLAYTLGVELVAETDKGLMFAASESLSLERLEEVLGKFEIKATGGGGAASLLDVFHEPDDARKLDEMLAGRVRQLWPFDNDTIYTFDLGIQTAASSRQVEWTRVSGKRKDESLADHAERREETRRTDRQQADEVWMGAADERAKAVQEIIDHYGGQALSGHQSDEATETPNGVVFPDSIEIRVRMSGQGFRDLVLNFPNLFEVSFPQDVSFLPGSEESEGDGGDLEIRPPSSGAATVCVIDSGIQEAHRWLEPGIDAETSRCFLPEADADDVADYVAPRGHGTRVAGAVMFRSDIPKDGIVDLIVWVQNARVLGKDNHLPITLPPERYLTDVVRHFRHGSRRTKIFNHSIHGNEACPTERMCSWAAKLDDLSHSEDVLFIQISGNVQPSEITEAIEGGLAHPQHLLEGKCQIASPGQSLHALTVGSAAHAVSSAAGWKTFATEAGQVSGFSRSGYAAPWGIVKPEVVEFGGDRWHSDTPGVRLKSSPETSPELVASTLHGEAAISKDDVGTSFAAPKVAHVAAHLQNLFPDASPLLYRALIVQSARWPSWASGADPDEVLRTIGYGVPSLKRATENTSTRATLVTADAAEIWSKQFHLYHFTVPEEIRSAASEASIRIDVSLAYTSTPRRTRSRRTGYLETWLDWRSINRGEPLSHFRERMEGIKKAGRYGGLPWTIHQSKAHGEVEETSRDRGSLQKDWAVIEAHEMPSDFAIAVRAHVGWNHKPQGGLARYCLAVSFEAVDVDLPVYSTIQEAVRVEVEQGVEAEINVSRS